MFYYQNKYYLQIQGTAMGALFASIHADLFMAHIEEQLIYDHTHNLYLDETDIWMTAG